MASLAKLATIEVERVSGLSGQRGQAVRRAGIETVADLLMHVPRRYLDRSRVEPMHQVPINSEVTLIARVLSITSRRARGRLVLTEAMLSDGTGTIKAVWFNQPFRERQLPRETEVALSGKVERFRGALQMNSPEVDVLSSGAEALRTGRVVPIHSGIGAMGPGWMRRAIHNALARARPISDPVPEDVIDRHTLASRDTALADIHFPETLDQVGPARRRLVFDELFRLELALALSKQRRMAEARGITHPVGAGLAEQFLAALPYRLTGAQKRALAEIRTDLAAPHPMHRLLQGEVGSGKTVVAVAMLLDGIAGGWQGAVMAPTEVLAAQHYLGISAMLDEAGLAPDLAGQVSELGMDSLFSDDRPAVRVGLLTSSQVAANFAGSATRAQMLGWVAAGEVDLVVGTHALIQEGVAFSRLGLAVVDEQHRFGALQRYLLKAKAAEVDPDLLIMTATPIPRTLSMTLYGDLDVTLIDEMPPGRIPVATRTISRSEEALAWELVRSEAAAGRQSFVVCPLVQESDKIEAASATAEYVRLQDVLAGLRLGLIHGQLLPREKEKVMTEFRRGDIDVLIATTVIEVGIDIPNATVIVIEDADRFGLSQLHQLRGRVGRGLHPGTCILLADPTGEDGQARLEAMVATTDGFELAEQDLRIRGQGTAFGEKQSGLSDLKLADILTDAKLLIEARREAFELVAADPELAHHQDLAEEVRTLVIRRDDFDWLFRS